MGCYFFLFEFVESQELKCDCTIFYIYIYTLIIFGNRIKKNGISLNCIYFYSHASQLSFKM